MKTLTLEPLRVLASALFWLVALPFGLIAFPTIAFVDRAAGIFRSDLAALAKHLSVWPA